MTAMKRVQTTITYKHPDTQPPVYLAGAFSDPPWQPIEMGYTTDESNQHEFHHQIDVEEGQSYEYKFRLGPGDWWVLDENTTTVTDGAGNRNNVLHISAPEIVVEKTVEPEKTVESPAFVALTEKESSIIDLEEVPPVVEIDPAEAHDSTLDSVAEKDEPTQNTYLRQLDGVTDAQESVESSVSVEEHKGSATSEIESVDEKQDVEDIAEAHDAQASPLTQEEQSETSDSATLKELGLKKTDSTPTPKQSVDEAKEIETTEAKDDNTEIVLPEPVQSLSETSNKSDSSSAKNVDEAVEATAQSSNSPPPEVPSRVKSRSPSPGQLFSKAHLLRLQDKKKSPPIKEAADGQDYLDKAGSDVKQSSEKSQRPVEISPTHSFSGPPKSPPRSRRTSSRSTKSSRPTLLAKSGERAVSDDLPVSKERVFPAKKPQSYRGSSSEESVNQASLDGLDIGPNKFHLEWSPLDWNPEAKAKYDEQHLRLEKIRKPLNHYYDDEKAAHRELLNSPRGKYLHSLYNLRHNKSLAATPATKDMWTYIRHLREEKRLRSPRKPNSIPLTWIFHLDEPQHPEYSAEALEDHIKLIEDEIAFYTHREKAEGSITGDRPNSWYSPSSHEFLDENRYLGSANSFSKSQRETPGSPKESIEYFATWEQKHARIIAKKGDIFNDEKNVQLDLLTKLEDAGVKSDSSGDVSPVSEEGDMASKQLVVDTDLPQGEEFVSDQETLAQTNDLSDSTAQIDSHPQPSNITPLFVGNRQLGDELRSVPVDGDGPQINIHPATPAPPSKDAEHDDKQLGHLSDVANDNDSASQLTVNNKRQSQLTDRPVTPNSINTANHDPKKTKNVFHTFLRFVFVEFWRGLFHKMTRFGRGSTNVIICLLVVMLAIVVKPLF